MLVIGHIKLKYFLQNLTLGKIRLIYVILFLLGHKFEYPNISVSKAIQHFIFFYKVYIINSISIFNQRISIKIL